MDCSSSVDHPWEGIYREEGRGESEPFPRFFEVVEAFKERGCSKILDLGCGTGRHLVYLAREGFRVYGLDISSTGLGLTKEWVNEWELQACVLLADMRRPLPFKEGSFEGIFSTQVIHHARIAAVRSAISEIYRLLSTDGVAFVTVSARKDDNEHIEIESGTFIPMKGKERGVPHHIFTEEKLRREFQRFNILEVSLRARGKVLAILAQKP